MKKIAASVLVLVSFIIACNTKSENKNTTGVDRLMDGNKRYQTYHPIHPDQTKERLTEISSAQHPFALIVSCSDSRVPPELVFDQGLGDLFVIRTAGHAIGDYELASVEYAVEHLHISNIIVLGHENCGAIKTLLEHPKDELPGHLNNLVHYLRAEPEEQALLSNPHHNLKDAIFANIDHAVNTIATSEPILKEKVAHKEVKVYGAYYHLTDGKVELVKHKA